MNHLSIDEIIEFVSFNCGNADIALIASVNEHIRKCPECLKLVQSFQLIYDEFSTMCLHCDFKKYIEDKEKDAENDMLYK